MFDRMLYVLLWINIEWIDSNSCCIGGGGGGVGSSGVVIIVNQL
jgi:hypothetical protein